MSKFSRRTVLTTGAATVAAAAVSGCSWENGAQATSAEDDLSLVTDALDDEFAFAEMCQQIRRRYRRLAARIDIVIAGQREHIDALTATLDQPQPTATSTDRRQSARHRHLTRSSQTARTAHRRLSGFASRTPGAAVRVDGSEPRGDGAGLADDEMTALDALQDCLAAEHAACFGYGVVGGVLAGIPDTSAEETRSDAFYVAHRQARDALTELIASLDADPVAAEAAYAAPPVATPQACSRLARLLEQRTAAVYAYAVSQTTDETRAMAADALTDCALRATAWGAPADPFPGMP